MRDLTLHDPTQDLILPHLRNTERMLASAATRLNGHPCEAEVVALPDLGMPHGVTRFVGGFFTGALYRWEGEVPFIPVDTTMNVDGVGVYRLSGGFGTSEDFHRAVQRARLLVDQKSSLTWNYSVGNHFISWCKVDALSGGRSALPSGDYLVLHASPAEYKAQYNGLYPTPDNWFWDSIETFTDARVPNRPLRILRGEKADRFARWSRLLQSIYHERQEFVASVVAEGLSLTTEMSVIHYGMPDSNSVAIGCQWMREDATEYLLLTEPGAPLLHVRALPGGENSETLDGSSALLTPHGLGTRLVEPQSLALDGTAAVINGVSVLRPGQTLRETNLIQIRPYTENDISRILAKCPGEVLGEMHPIASHYRGNTNEGR